MVADPSDRRGRPVPPRQGRAERHHQRRAHPPQRLVNRCVEVNGEHDVKRFSVWCPQVFAGIGTQADTLVDRSLTIGFRRKLPADAVERLPFDLHERMLRVRRQPPGGRGQLIRLGAMDDEPPACGNDRLRDNYTPLWRLAAVLGGAWPDRIAAAYAVHAGTGDDADEPAGIMLLRDMSGIFDDRSADRLQSAAMWLDLVAMEDRPWAEWRHGRPLTAQSIAKLLKPFGVCPRTPRSRVMCSSTTSARKSPPLRALRRQPPVNAATPLPR